MYTRTQIGLAATAFALWGVWTVGSAAWSRNAPEVKPSILFQVDVNLAGQAELELLPGIGPKRARAVIDSRRAEGRFESLEDLTRIKGIGPATVAGLRMYAKADGGP